MLPFIARNRRPISSDSMSSEDVNQMLNRYMKKAGSGIWRVPLKAKCIFLFLALLACYIFGSIYLLLWQENQLTTESFLETDKCPLCFGRSTCFALFDNQYELSALSKLHPVKYFNVKNVHYAWHRDENTAVVLKKLAHDSEYQKIDDQVCAEADHPLGCSVARNAVISKTVQDIYRNGLQPKHLKDKSFMFVCPSHRLIEDLAVKYAEKTKPSEGEEDMVLDDKIQILFTASVNSEPLLFQMFPHSDGWPFPQYYGACGRYIMVSNSGKSLQEFYHAPWQKRADLAYQVIKMADKLSNYDDNYILYWTDLSYENLAVDHSGKVTIVDAENIIVVDRELVKLVNPRHWDELHESKFYDCEGETHKNCLSFSADDLCSHQMSDHNYYVACRNLLSKFADDSDIGMPGGLLHDIPKYVEDKWDLDHLLHECTNPSQVHGRMKVVQKLIMALDSARQNTPEEMERKDIEARNAVKEAKSKKKEIKKPEEETENLEKEIKKPEEETENLEKEIKKPEEETENIEKEIKKPEERMKPRTFE